MNRKMTTQKIGKGIQIRAGMGQEEIQKLADSDLTLSVRLTNNFAYRAFKCASGDSGGDDCETGISGHPPAWKLSKGQERDSGY